MQQVSQVLKSEGYGFRVSTPAGTARLTSERSADDYIEIAMDTAGPVPVVLARVNRTWGRERFSDEHILASGDAIPGLTDVAVCGPRLRSANGRPPDSQARLASWMAINPPSTGRQHAPVNPFARSRSTTAGAPG